MKKRALSLLAIMVLIFDNCLCPPPAESGSMLDQLRVLGPEMLTLVALEWTAYSYDRQITDKTKELYNMEYESDQLNQENYKRDHTPLAPQYKIWSDQTAGLEKIYTALESSGALSFAADISREKFDAQNPGYRLPAPGNYIDFAAAYRLRANDFRSYSLGVAIANNAESQSVLDAQSVIKRQNDASIMSGESKVGYLQMLQAGAQTRNHTNQIVSRLRVDIGRQIEAETKFALNELQERTDRHAAFRQAVRDWKSQSYGTNY
ncbi:MAG: hypothetical protein LBL73_10940 [Synergistaceae bacterium]|jgi:hypothetical protein|nr:hypothetical protein [Synergistaceae bacterium]